MGANVLTRDQKTSPTLAEAERYPQLAHRFQAYFGPLFAYVHSCVGDTETTVELVAEAFARSFAQAEPSPGDEEFRLRLFLAARQLCRPFLQRRRGDNGALSPRELEVLSLIFDGQLTRKEVGKLLHMNQGQVATTTFSALKKLRQEPSRPSSTPSLVSTPSP